jgi:hypothetical protein
MFSGSSAAGTVNGCASGLEHGFKAGVHFFFFDTLAALGCDQSFFHSSQEAGFFGERTDNNIRHQSLGDGPCFSGGLRNRRLLFGVKCTSIAFRCEKNWLVASE